MVSDTEPRYRLKDPNTGDIVGSLYVKSDGTIALQESTSGSDNELLFNTDGTIVADNVPTIERGEIVRSVGASGDDTWGTRTNDTTSISFSKSFDTEPTIVANSEDVRLQTSADSITTSGFDLTVTNFTDLNLAASVQWVAVEI